MIHDLDQCRQPRRADDWLVSADSNEPVPQILSRSSVLGTTVSMAQQICRDLEYLGLHTHELVDASQLEALELTSQSPNRTVTFVIIVHRGHRSRRAPAGAASPGL
jgi:hypothetical protein